MASNGYDVTGPGPIEKNGIAAFGAALAFALDKASRLEKVGTFYVRLGDEVVAYAEKLEGGGAVSRIRKHDEPEIEKPVAIAVSLDDAIEEAA